jgi:lysophospholipase L1-like esterase
MTDPSAGSAWLGTWAAAPQLTGPEDLPPAPFTREKLVLADATVRQSIRTSVGGRQARLRFSNAFGRTVLPITRVSVALPAGGQAGNSAIEPASAAAVTFHGRPSAVVPVGAQVVSDPLDFPVPARTNLTVTMYLQHGQAGNTVTSHPGSRTTSHFVSGDHVADRDLPGAMSADHWYFLSGLEVRACGAALVVVGDSLTDGRGSTTNQNDRWPDRLVDRLHANPDTADVAVLNQGIGGNRILIDGPGQNLLARLDRDVFAGSGVRWLAVAEGINDIGTAAATGPAQRQIAGAVIAAYHQIIERAHAQHLLVYGSTLLPFGGNSGYDDPAGLREQARQTVNAWIRTSRRFDAVVDFDRIGRDPAHPDRLLSTFDEGDHIHLNPLGYRAMGDAVALHLFRPDPVRASGPATRSRRPRSGAARGSGR